MTCFSEWRLCSKKRWGSVVSMAGCGKLYLGVVVIVYCSITKIHQYAISIGEIFNCCACTYCAIQYATTVDRRLTETSSKPPIKVKMKIGDIEFEIESQEDQIQTAVDRILQTVTARLREVQQVQPTTERPASPPRAETCKGIIQKLWEEGWFSQSKSLDDVHSE